MRFTERHHPCPCVYVCLLDWIAVKILYLIYLRKSIQFRSKKRSRQGVISNLLPVDVPSSPAKPASLRLSGEQSHAIVHPVQHPTYLDHPTVWED